MADSIQQQKKLLRTVIRDKIASLDEGSIQQQSEAVTAKAIASKEYQNANSISIFLAMPKRELSTTQIALTALRDGKQVFIPYIHPEHKGSKSKVMSMLRLQDENDLNSLKPDAWGIPSISHESAGNRQNALGGQGPLFGSHAALAFTPLDLIFMPALAFDQSMHRLGHGKGFYDKYLSQLHELATSQDKPFPALVGLALREQILEGAREVPTTDEDWRVDQVLVAD